MIAAPIKNGIRTVKFAASGLNADLPLALLYQEHYEWLYLWLRKKTGNSHHAEDIAQDTFARILQSHQILFDIHEPRAFLTTTAKNIWINQLKRQQFEAAYLSELQVLQQQLEQQTSLEQSMMILSAIEQISLALHKVSSKARHAFVAHFMEGYTYVEIANQLGVSTKMIQKYLSQCLVACYTIQRQLEFDI
ncbi:RNA polymerase sigma-70 factor, ECF subfamily [Acinetobacter puyangensis]|uniref:RNA polymerase sigma-70 factor, ECF subfamily n=1 Tax=Acinetobacter puyangensis TaxID=1096779 RepID=A0A240EDA3_9GAMM|nr:RNA polymerase sigma-70 factor, ECF subfamily [Acinetobacter puyangensis]